MKIISNFMHVFDDMSELRGYSYLIRIADGFDGLGKRR